MAEGKTGYSVYRDYALLLKKKCSEESSEGGCSEGCGGCSEGCEEQCGCCPAGLVAIEDGDGKHIGCLTPNDANLFMVNAYKCPSGYVKVLSVSGGVTTFIGCLTPSEYATYIAAVPA